LINNVPITLKNYKQVFIVGSTIKYEYVVSHITTKSKSYGYVTFYVTLDFLNTLSPFLYMTTIWLVINSQFHKQSKYIDELSFISFGSFNKITKSSLNMFQTMHGQIGYIYANLHKLEKFQHLSFIVTCFSRCPMFIGNTFNSHIGHLVLINHYFELIELGIFTNAIMS
jgi:hypothetical protein